MDHANSKLFECMYCSEKFISRKDVIRHTKSCQSNSWVCVECDTSTKFCNKYILRRHMKQKHGPNKRKAYIDSELFECAYCSKKYNFRTDIVRHIKNRQLNSWICIECDPNIKFCNKCMLQRHMKQKHRLEKEKSCTNSELFECAHCSKKYNLRRDIVRHIKNRQSSSWICKECDTNIKFCTKHILQRHLKQKHGPKRGKPCTGPGLFECAYCSKTYTLRRDIVRHIKNRLANSWVCAECDTDTKFCNKNVLRKHVREKHRPSGSELIGSYFKCLECRDTFPSRTIINDHYSEVHEIPVMIENLSFSCMEEFEDWKSQMQRETITQFRKRGQYKTLQSTVKLYICNRTGLYHNLTPVEERKRMLKTCGYKQIGGYCPAQIKVIELEESCLVEYCSTHIGHEVGNELDLRHIYMEKQERLKIAQKIRSGISAGQIIHQEISNPENNRSKLKLICNKDVRNIAVAHNLGFKGRRQSKWETDMVDAEDFLIEHEDDVIFYKKQGADDSVFQPNDFVLILMNRMQEKHLQVYGSKLVIMGSASINNPYDFILHSLLVISEDCESILVAFVLSNRSDEDLITFFLCCLRDRVGIISTETFMSEMQVTYYNSWLKVMNQPTYHLFCSWYVNESWRRKLSRIKNKATKETIRQKLYEMSREPNPLIFEEKLDSFLSLPFTDKEMKKFVEYFRDSYSKIAPFWACCHRQQMHINADMAVENFHRSIKYQIVGGRKIENLSQLLQYIYEFLDTQAHKNERKRILGAIPSKLTLIRQKHSKAVEESVEIIPVNEEFFLVDDYSVTKSKEKECILYHNEENAVCSLLCALCNICFHEYKCSCVDFTISNNMCQHIHAVGLYLKDDPNSYATTDLKMDCSVYLSTPTSPDHDYADYWPATDVDSTAASTSTATADPLKNLDEIKTIKDLKQQMMEEFSKSLDVAVCEDNLRYIMKHFIKPIVPVVCSLNTADEDDCKEAIVKIISK